MAVPQEITRLIERYDAQREAYESGQYKETEIRVEFIDPFFKALGWDVHNEQGYAEAYKDVIHEEALTELVGRMLALHAKQRTARTPSDQTAIAREIVATDGQIDRMVYELYGLTSEEVQIVEQAGTT